MEIRFGPGGLGNPPLDGLDKIKKAGLSAAEVEFTYGVYMDEATAKKIGAKAKELGISLSIHAPYYINLTSEDLKKREQSKKRILQACEKGHYLGARYIVLHAAFYGKLEKQGKADQTAPEVLGLRIDEANRAVWVDGVRVAVSGQSYDLLHYLYVHAGQLCTRRQLVEEVLTQTYDETDTSQVSRLNTAIRRLREKIEEEPGQPRYLHTEPSMGYRLVRQPETQAWQP